MANTIRLKRASGSDPGASDLVTGELAVRTDTGKLFTKKDDNSVTEIGVTGNAATATKLETARTIAGVSFDGSANISLNNNAITNGAGYITATLTNEQVQDIVGGMVTGNTETGITVTYQDGDGTLDFVVGTLNQDTTGNAATATALETARNIGGVSFDGTGNINLPGVNTSGNQDTSGNAATATALATARTIAGVSFDGTGNISLNNNAITNGAGYITATLTEEQVEDFVGGMVTGNTETGITVTYQDSDGTLDFVVASQTDNNFTDTLKNKLDGIAASATNVTNNNQLTNGAGYITATLTNEQVQDIVGNMVTGNTESGISVTYQDSDGTLDFSVTSQTDNNFTTTLKNKLDGIASGATNVTNTNQLTNGAGFITSADGGNAATLDSLDSTSFLRSDAADSGTGLLSLSGGIAFSDAAKCTAAVSALSDGSTITVDFTSGIHHSVTLGGNRTFGNPSNDGSAVGQSGSIFITQDGTGSRTASFHSDYKFVGGTAPTLSTAANAVDRLDYVIKASGVIHCVVSLDIK